MEMFFFLKEMTKKKKRFQGRKFERQRRWKMKDE